MEPDGNESVGGEDGTSYDCGIRDNRGFFGILHLDRAPLTKAGTLNCLRGRRMIVRTLKKTAVGTGTAEELRGKRVGLE